MNRLPVLNTNVGTPMIGPETSSRKVKGFFAGQCAIGEAGMVQVDSPQSVGWSFVESIRKTASCDEYMPSAAEIKAVKEKKELKKIYSMPPKMKQKLAPLASPGAFINTEYGANAMTRTESWKSKVMNKSPSWKSRPDSGVDSVAAVAPDQRIRSHDLSIDIPARDDADIDNSGTLTERMLYADEYIYSDELGIDEFTPPPLVNRNSSRMNLFVKF